MHPHKNDENSASNQDHDQGDKPHVVRADRAHGVPGAEPPLEAEPARIGHRHDSAAGLYSIWETTHRGLRDMGVKRSLRTLLAINQKDGFDCPSCAWPDPDDQRKKAEFCENGAKAVASEATTARATPELFAQYSITDMLAHTDRWLDAQGRITQPMLRRQGADHYQPVAWQEAFAIIGRELGALASPDEAVFYTSGRASNEAAFLYGLMARQLGTNNLPDCSNMCHESSGLGLTETIGIGKSTVKIDDFALADSIFVIGQNPGTCHPRMLTELQKAARNGCKIVSINPLSETGLKRFKNPQEPLAMLGRGTPIATLFLPVRVNGDVALLKGIMKEMLDADRASGGRRLAHDFIQHYTEGWDDFVRDLDAESWDLILRGSGVSRALIREAADIALASQRMICSWAMGITQHGNGVANVQTIVNFALLRGQIGRRGAGLCPVRGHSNVQGDRTVGIWEKMSPEFMKALGAEFNFTPPAAHGFDVVKTIQAMAEGKVKVFVALGGNFLSASPDTHYTSEAMRRCRLTVQIATKINRGHLITGQEALILPCLGRTERDQQASGQQFVTVEDTTGVVHQSRGVLDPASPHLRSEVAIIAGIARAALGTRSTVDWEGLAGDYDRVRAHIEHVVPGFTQYNARVREPGGFYLPNGPREGKFTTKSGKACFTVHPIPRHDLAPGQLLLTTLRSHDQFNTTIYGDDDRYRGIYGGRRVVFLNQEDIAELGLVAGDWVDLTSHFGAERRRAARFRVVAYEIPRGCAAAYYPETNPLVPLQAVADGSNQPASKSVVITLAPGGADGSHLQHQTAQPGGVADPQHG
ncbi:MAG TPA: FdhF/YdeP family oxidoreductase [Polyangia bacterium]|nr:FdhF/YdeP family oxidoreductase [Polyangia bacterium]